MFTDMGPANLEAELKENLRAPVRRISLDAHTRGTRCGREPPTTHGFMDRLDSGQIFTARKHNRTVQWFSNNWPEGADAARRRGRRPQVLDAAQVNPHPFGASR
jgi:hypothetical protein